MRLKPKGDGDVSFCCDRCSKVIYKSMSVKEWTGFRVCKTCLDLRDPADFMYLPIEDVSVKDGREATPTVISAAIAAQVAAGESPPGDGTDGVPGGFEWYLPNGIDS